MSSISPPPSSPDAQQAQNPRFIRDTFGVIAARYDQMNHILSGGMDFFWRRRAVKTVAAWQPLTILDLATGSGDLARMLKQANPQAQVIGADFCIPMLQVAQRKGISPLIVADALQLPLQTSCLDVITIAFGLRNMAHWTHALQECARVLRPGGYIVVLDFSLPSTPVWCTLYRLYLHHILPRLTQWLTGNGQAYEYLGASIETFPSGAAFLELMANGGFEAQTATPLTGGIVSLYVGQKKVTPQDPD